jgi:predicted mannosyl-3-phosphoglycerate phosphatase (HAD superfamily)
MADTLEQIAEHLTRLALDHDSSTYEAQHDEILSALQSLARERDALRANEDAIRSTYGWKRDGRELPDLVAELVATPPADASPGVVRIASILAASRSGERSHETS